MDHSVLGKILATVVIAAIDAGAIVVSSGGLLTDPQAVGNLEQGFLEIWLQHPASGQPKPKVTAKG